MRFCWHLVLDVLQFDFFSRLWKHSWIRMSAGSHALSLTAFDHVAFQELPLQFFFLLMSVRPWAWLLQPVGFFVVNFECLSLLFVQSFIILVVICHIHNWSAGCWRLLQWSPGLWQTRGQWLHYLGLLLLLSPHSLHMLIMNAHKAREGIWVYITALNKSLIINSVNLINAKTSFGWKQSQLHQINFLH